MNSWQPFRERWRAEGQPLELASATVLMVQEHHLVQSDLCRDAEDFCGQRGWHAVFREAVRLPSGRSSGGVALLVRKRDDIGVTDPGLDPGPLRHRLLGLKLAMGGTEPLVIVSAYLQAGVGLNELNMQALSTIAQWQELVQLPVLAGGDFNVPPNAIDKTDFSARSGMIVLTPGAATYRTAQAATEIDYFLVTRSVAERMRRPQLLDDWPTKPHVAVRFGFSIGEADKAPILEMPTRLPLDEPFGPRREARQWTELHDRVREAHRYLELYATSQPERLQILDQLYAHFAQLFEQHMCERTDTPQQRRSRRCRAPRIRWVTAETRSKQHFKSWHTLERPLHWL